MENEKIKEKIKKIKKKKQQTKRPPMESGTRRDRSKHCFFLKGMLHEIVQQLRPEQIRLRAPESKEKEKKLKP